VLDKVAASSPHSAELAKRAAGAEIEARMQQELPLARERLARLVESRAKELANALTAEQIAELVEQRSQETAQGCNAERMKLETEAVRAELDVT
jgi:hypothetical protein